jgi:YidC/Oxa1 family membrane protein insertase
MSKSAAPPPKGNFLQTLLFMMMVFIGIQLFFGQRNATPDVRSSEEILAAMRTQNAELKDVTLASTSLPQLQKRVEAEVQAGQLTAEQSNVRLFEGKVLVIEAQLRSGIERFSNGRPDGLTRLSNAYQTAENLRKQYGTTQLWGEHEVQVADVRADGRFGWSAWTGNELYTRVVTELSTRNRESLVLGFIPGYQMIDFMVRMTGAVPAFSYAFAALVLAIIVRAFIWPLAQRQLMWSRQMGQLGPLVTEIREQYKDNPQEQNMRVMNLYKEYGINPMAGCLPMMIQLPFFLVIYQCMLHYRFEFQKGFFLWVNPQTGQMAPGMLASNLGQQDNLLILLYGISMIITMLLTPVADPAQRRQQRIMSVVITVFFTGTMFLGLFPVPAAFVLYWIFTNMLATFQTLRAYRLPLPPLEKKAVGVTGGVLPVLPSTNGKKRDDRPLALNGQVKTGAPAKHKPKKRK